MVGVRTSTDSSNADMWIQVHEEAGGNALG